MIRKFGGSSGVDNQLQGVDAGLGKYNAGSEIDAASMSANSFICDFIFKAATNFLMSIDCEANESAIYFSYYLTATSFSVYKFVRNAAGISPLYSQSVVVNLYSSGASTTGVVTECGQYVYVTCGNCIYQLNKSNLSTVKSVTLLDYSIVELRVSDDGTYLFGIVRDSAGYMFVFKYTLDLVLISSIATNLGYNYVFCGVDNRSVIGGSSSGTGFVVDTKTMIKTMGSQYYLSVINGAYFLNYHRRPFWSGGYLFIFHFSTGAVYKCSVTYNGDGSVSSITLVSLLTYYSYGWTNVFDYDDNYIYAEKCSVTNFTLWPVLINKNTLMVEKHSPIQTTQLVDDATVQNNIYLQKLKGFFCKEYVSWNGQTGYTGRYFLIKRKTKILS